MTCLAWLIGRRGGGICVGVTGTDMDSSKRVLFNQILEDCKNIVIYNKCCPFFETLEALLGSAMCCASLLGGCTKYVIRQRLVAGSGFTKMQSESERGCSQSQFILDFQGAL